MPISSQEIFVVIIASILLVTFSHYAFAQSSSIVVIVSPQTNSVDSQQTTTELCGPPVQGTSCQGYSVKEGESITIGVSVSGGVPPYKVNVFNDGALVASDNTEQYYTYVLPYLSPGLYNIAFLAWDSQGTGSKGGVATVSVTSSSSPSTTISNGSATSILSGALTIYAPNLTIQQGSSEAIRLTNSVTGGKPPLTYQWLEKIPSTNAFQAVDVHNGDYTFDTTGLAIGTYQFQFKEVDANKTEVDSNIVSVDITQPTSSNNTGNPPNLSNQSSFEVENSTGIQLSESGWIAIIGVGVAIIVPVTIYFMQKKKKSDKTSKSA